MRLIKLLIAVIVIIIWACAAGASDDRFAARVISYDNLGVRENGDPNAVIGKPSTWITQTTGTIGQVGTYACSIIYAAWNPTVDSPKAVTTVGTSLSDGYIIVEFDQPIYDDPKNWFGMDFIVFGNTVFTGYVPGGYIGPSTNMELCKISTSSLIGREPVTVSVRPDDTVDWYTYASPKADDIWPMNAFAWDKTTHAWSSNEQDWTQPVDPDWTVSKFVGKYIPDAIDLYNGSAGGTAFDLKESGFTYIRYIKITGRGGDIDGFARVSHMPTIAELKQLPDGATVHIARQIVTAGSTDLGDCFYVESPDKACGIKVTGATADRNTVVALGGVLATVNGEREIQAAWAGAETTGYVPVTPLGMSNKSLGGGNYYYNESPSGIGQRGIDGANGANNIGLLVRTWGEVKSKDINSHTFSISDGSSRLIKCIAPSDVTLPDLPQYVRVTGISSCEADAQGKLSPVVRIRCQGDIQY